MATQNGSPFTTSFPATMLYAVCLLAGLLIGYLVRGNTGRVDKSSATAGRDTQQQITATPSAPHQMPTLEQMKSMADKKAEPLLQQLKTDPNDASVLFQTGKLYESAHQFKEALSFYDKSLALDPKNIEVLSAKASCLYYSGDADRAISILNSALQSSPNEPRLLFNLGVMHWQGKADAKGAVELWQKLLKTNPKLDAHRKAQVEDLIKQVATHQTSKITGS